MQIIYNKIENITIKNGESNSYCVINPNGNFKAELTENACLKIILIFTEDVKFNAEFNLNGKNASCNIGALYLLKNKVSADFTATVNHKTTDTKSRQNIKGVADNNASFNFTGIVDVETHAIKTDAEQLHMGLLLSDDAKITASPQLMIRADDVKCSHGSAVGDLDRNQIFYLRSRGIDEKDARKILINAFFTDILAQIEDTKIKKICYEKLDLEYDE